MSTGVVKSDFQHSRLVRPEMKMIAWAVTLSILFTTSFLSISFERAEGYTIGLKAGKQATYTVAGSFWLLGPNITGNISKVKFEIAAVNQLNVTIKYVYIYTNGTTQLADTLAFNVRWCDYRSHGPSVIIAANLTAGDKLCDYDYQNYTLNPNNAFTVNNSGEYKVGTITRIANYFSMKDYYNDSFSYVYDRATGILLQDTIVEGRPLVIRMDSTDIFPGVYPIWNSSYLTLVTLTSTAAMAWIRRRLTAKRSPEYRHRE